MRINVHEYGDEIHIALDGIAGRQQRVLQVISQLRRNDDINNADATGKRFIFIRAGSKNMVIKLRNHDEQRYDANAIYRDLRHALLQHPRLNCSGG